MKELDNYYFAGNPKLSHLNWAIDNDIINALNRLLEQLFSKSNDLVIHFFDIKMIKKIIDTIFPEDYLTTTDNTSEDISIKNLLNVISSLKIEEKNI